MKVLGIAIKKGELWFSVLDGTTKDSSNIVLIDKRNFQAEQDLTELMLCFHNLFSELITEHTPASIGVKLSLDADMDQIPYMHCSLGILAYICRKDNIKLTTRSTRWITAAKRKKLLECEQLFSDYNLKNEKLHATVVALHELEVTNY